ncbi:MAG: hypothetical protein ACT4OU_03115 [Hyphomicrobium sp.]
MIEMVRNSIGLFFRGRLFAEPAKAYLQLAIGVLFTALCFLVALNLAGLPYWTAAGVAGFLGGALQPYLFRNLRYR